MTAPPEFTIVQEDESWMRVHATVKEIPELSVEGIETRFSGPYRCSVEVAYMFDAEDVAAAIRAELVALGWVERPWVRAGWREKLVGWVLGRLTR